MSDFFGNTSIHSGCAWLVCSTQYEVPLWQLAALISSPSPSFRGLLHDSARSWQPQASFCFPGAIIIDTTEKTPVEVAKECMEAIAKLRPEACTGDGRWLRGLLSPLIRKTRYCLHILLTTPSHLPGFPDY